MTHRVSVFSKGLLNMKSTLVGIVRVDPRELLESGIRDELTLHIKAALDANLNFASKSKVKIKSGGNTNHWSYKNISICPFKFNIFKSNAFTPTSPCY